MNAKSKRLDRASSAKPDKFLPPAAYRAWRRKLANQARGEARTADLARRASLYNSLGSVEAEKCPYQYPRDQADRVGYH
jgi:hypothetical protein